MKDTAIEWAESTCNFFVGCSKVSEGCTNCYMYRMENRFGRNPAVVRKTDWNARQTELRKWEPQTIFVNSMSDTFHKDISDSDVEMMFTIMQTYSKHTYIVLTKRIERAVKFFEGRRVPDNIWIGTSIENMKYLSRMEILKKINARIHFISFEPLLGDVEKVNLDGIQWVIVGGESDPKPRKMEQTWVDRIFEECKQKDIPFFFKQWGGSSKCDCHKSWGCRIYRGTLWNQMPKVALA